MIIKSCSKKAMNTLINLTFPVFEKLEHLELKSNVEFEKRERI